MARIGSVAAPSTSVAPVRSSVSADAFGAGVGRALEGLSGAFAAQARSDLATEASQTDLHLAYKQRQDKLTRAEKQVEFIRLQNEISRGIPSAYDEQPIGAPQFTNLIDSMVQTRTEEFLNSVPADMRTEFTSQIETLRQGATNAALQMQISAENAEFSKSVLATQGDIVELLTTVTITDANELDAMEDLALSQLDALFAASPLDQATTRDLREQVMVTISSAKLGRLAVEEALNNLSNGGSVPGALTTEGNVVKSRKPVAAGLSAAAVGILTAISGPESNGEYNAMYSPEGGPRRYFTDFSRHPNDPALIPVGPNAGKVSTAAGKYQFIYSTWMEAKNALGLEDFSPESQDRAAWWLAQRDYAAKTGRNLEAVLRSGHGPSIAAVREYLTSTWEGLGNITDAEFISAVGSGTQNVSSLVNDDEFQHIPMDQRFAIVQDAMSAADGLRTQMAATAQAERDAAIEDLTRRLTKGDATTVDILKAVNQFNLPVAEQEKLQKIFDEYHEEEINAGNFLTNINDPQSSFDPTDTQDKANSAAFFNQTKAKELIGESDEAYVDNAVVPTVRATGYIPANLSNLLTQQSNSQNPQTADFAYATMAKLQAEAPDAFEAAFGGDRAKMTALYNAAQGSIPQEELLNYLRQSGDPAMRALYAERDKQITKLFSDNPDDFTPAGISESIGLSGTPDMAAGSALFREYIPVYQYMYGLLGNHSKAQEAASNVLKTRWGEFELGGVSRVMRYPPSVTAQPFNDSFAYVEEQLRADFGFGPQDNYSLVSDHITDAQFNSSGTASYEVVTYDLNGMPHPMTYGDTAEFDPKTDRHIAHEIARFHPRITTQMKTDQRERVMAESRFRVSEAELARRIKIQKDVGDVEGARGDEEKLQKLREDNNRRLGIPNPEDLQANSQAFGGAAFGLPSNVQQQQDYKRVFEGRVVEFPAEGEKLLPPSSLRQKLIGGTSRLSTFLGDEGTELTRELIAQTDPVEARLKLREIYIKLSQSPWSLGRETYQRNIKHLMQELN